MNETFFCPTEIIFGAGVLEKLTEKTKNYGTNCLFVMDPFFKTSPLKEKIASLLPDKKITYYAEVTPNPRTNDIDAGGKLCVENQIDFIVALGGGSAIDTAKAINIVATNGSSSWLYTKVGDRKALPITKKLLPLIAIPSTSGTGTEATRYSVITNSENHQKATIKFDEIFPTISFVDPQITASMPRKTTALTGIDAFAHNFEAYIGSKNNDFSEMFALKGIKLFAKSIRKACNEPNDLEARSDIALCSTLGGLSISHSATTLPHSIGQALSGITDAPHGGSIAVCMPEILEWTLPCAQEKMAKVACIFDASLKTKSEKEQADALPVILDNLFKEIIGQDLTMKDYGLTEDRIDDVVAMAMNNYHGDIDRHPKTASATDLRKIIEKAF